MTINTKWKGTCPRPLWRPIVFYLKKLKQETWSNTWVNLMILNINGVEWARKLVQMVNERKTIQTGINMKTFYSQHSKFGKKGTTVWGPTTLNKLGQAWPPAGIGWKTSWRSAWLWPLIFKGSDPKGFDQKDNTRQCKLPHYPLPSLHALYTTFYFENLSIRVNCNRLGLTEIY